MFSVVALRQRQVDGLPLEIRMDFEKARFNMVEQQIRPWDVHDEKALMLSFHVKRENFVSEDKRSLAFADMELPLPNGAHMFHPKVESRIIQELALQNTDKVLEIGTGSGYLTALLASCAQWVFSIEIDPLMKQIAEQNLKKAGINNVTLYEGNGLEGLEAEAPFDVILIGGSMHSIPVKLTKQLALGGRMIGFIGDLPVMKAKRFFRTADNKVLETNLFETCVARLSDPDATKRGQFNF